MAASHGSCHPRARSLGATRAPLTPPDSWPTIESANAAFRHWESHSQSAQDPEPRIYNLGAAEFGTIREDFQAVLDAAGFGKRVVSLPAKPTLTVLRALERTRLSPVYGRLLHKLLDDSFVDISRARERLRFRPQQSNRDAILRTYEWWRGRPKDRSSVVGTGRTSRDAWRQGALGLAKVFF